MKQPSLKPGKKLYELAQVLTRYTDTGRVIRSGFNPNGLGFPFLAALNLQQGVPLFSLEDPRQTPAFDS